MSSENNKRIAKNTLMLYFRMFITMAVSLYTSRIVLELLGVTNYGVYNVVGGIVAMSSFITSSMSNGVQRFITFALGDGDKENLKKIFGMCINIQLLIAVVILLVLETAGLWFLNTQLNIPYERMNAANWVYQFSILTLLLNITSSSYSAAVIAYEKMTVFAYVSIVEVTLKLGLVFTLSVISFDSLKVYAILMFLSSLIIRIIYQVYCHLKIKDIRYTFFWNRKMFSSILSFSGWNMFGGLTVVLGNQGVSIILNIFFGVIANAAKGVSLQVSSALFSFHSNILTALRPPIIKAYAQRNFENMKDLTYRGAKYSFLMLLFISLPVILETDLVLRLWLKEVPEYATIFTRLILIISLIDCLSATIMIVSQATGDIKRYNLGVSSVLILQLPLSYVSLKLGFVPESVFYVNIIVSIIALFTRVHLVHLLVSTITIKEFTKKVLTPAFSVLVVASLITVPLVFYLNHTVISFIIIGFASVVSIAICSYFLGTDVTEREYVKRFISKILKRV